MSGPDAVFACACNKHVARDVVPANAIEDFKNDRRERSCGIMVKTACLVKGCKVARSLRACKRTRPVLGSESMSMSILDKFYHSDGPVIRVREMLTRSERDGYVTRSFRER